jgi:lipid-A-disaccharide synthase
VDATFVGHPLAELPHPAIERDDYAGQMHLDSAKPWITLMPGSRVKEVRMNLPTIMEAAAQLGSSHEFLLPVAPTLDRSFILKLIARHTNADRLTADRSPAGRSPADQATVQPKITLVPESLPALWHSRAGIVASGTATVEAAMMCTPFAMVYRVSPLTYLLGKPRVKVPHFAMVNLIAGEEIVPELVQQDFTATNIVTRLNEILPDGPARDRMLEGLARVKARLRAPQATSGAPQHPADRASEIILSLSRSPKP